MRRRQQPSIWRHHRAGSVSNGGVAVFSAFRTPIWSHAAAIALGAIAAAALLSTHPAKPQSLAAYLSAICATSFGSAASAEAAYLADNVSALTKMTIDMGIDAS